MNLQNKKTGLLFVFLAFLLVYLFTLNLYPLMSPDETRYAQIAREMIQSNDWVVPRLNGLDYFEKPVFGYWAFMACQAVFGESPFSARLSSALAIGLISLFIYWFLKRQVKETWLPLAGSFIFFSSILAIVVGRIMLLDSLLTLFLTLSLGFFFLGSETSNRKMRNGFLLAAGFAAGLAFLTKGFLALALIGVVVVPFLCLQKRFLDLLRLGWVPVLTAVIVALPWSLLVHERAPDYWHYFFWVEHIERFLGASKGQHPEPIWFYVPMLFIGFFPWSLFLKKSMNLKRWFSSNLMRFLSLWILAPFVFLSLSTGKLATYLLPIIPAVSMWLIIFLKEQSEEDLGKAINIRIGLLLAFLILLSGFLLISPKLNELYSNSMKLRFFLLFFSWPIFLILAWLAKGQKKWALFGSSHLVFFGLLPLLLPSNVIENKAPEAFLTSQATRITPDTILIANGNTVRPLCWFLNRDDVFLVGDKGELAYGLESQKDRFISETNFERFVVSARQDRDIALFMTKDDWSTLKNYISNLYPTIQNQNRSYVMLFFKRERLQTQ